MQYTNNSAVVFYNTRLIGVTAIFSINFESRIFNGMQENTGYTIVKIVVWEIRRGPFQVY